MAYKTAQAWKEAAMQRAQGVDDVEAARREQVARAHILQEGKEPSDDVWEDYTLYVMGKMDLEEYQAYLLFKHSGAAK
ncbi:MAG: hypothetical protein Q9M14_06865 [Mariprofundaceae bacterium]|nr:hypothetical protein [Mariprofundaceae bacterium]